MPKAKSATKTAVEDILPATQFRPSKKVGYFLSPIVFILMLMTDPPAGLTVEAWRVMCVAALMAIWWITEALPLTATAFLPLVTFPFLGIMDLRATAQPYASPIIFLFLGGFMIALAMQKWRLHLRIALTIVNLIGTKPDRMVAGFMISGAFLSMWISNTATIMMMLPLTIAVIELLNKQEKAAKIDPVLKKNFAVAMLLGICYCVSIGGVGTVIGTPPNAFFKGFIESNYGYQISFVEWMMVGVPFVCVMLTICWVLLTKILFPLKGLEFEGSKELITLELEQIGKMSRGEKLVALVCIIVACGWIFQGMIKQHVPFLTDSAIAMMGCLLLFIIPVNFNQGVFLMRWEDTQKLPWGVLFLFGGGLGLAGGFREVKLDQWIGLQVEGLAGVDIIYLIIAVILLVLLLTEIMSNIATTTILVPVVSAVAIGMGQNPLLLAIPATMAASCGFMMPVATAANAIIFGTGQIKMRQMLKTGGSMHLVDGILIIIVLYMLAMSVFDIQMGVLPEWVTR